MILFNLILGMVGLFFAGATFGLALNSRDYRDWYMSALGAFFGIYLIISAIVKILA
jgi:uncharacterized membrane protein YeaQ/YmgE (transglycosylase-associated protein family)